MAAVAEYGDVTLADVGGVAVEVGAFEGAAEACGTVGEGAALALVAGAGEGGGAGDSAPGVAVVAAEVGTDRHQTHLEQSVGVAHTQPPGQGFSSQQPQFWQCGPSQVQGAGSSVKSLPKPSVKSP